VTQAEDPTAPVNEAGQFNFPGLAPGTYVVREQVPVGTVETAPSAASVTNTIDFDGTGAESGITGAGVSSFTYQSASFSGGTIFAASQSALLASGALAYNATSGSAQVNFGLPISSVTFFYVSGDGFAAGTATAFGPDGSTLGSVNSNPATTFDAPGNFVTLSFAQPIARITFSGGVIDNFSFTTEANDQAEFVRVQPSQTVSGIAFGNQSTVASTDLVASNVTPTPTGFTATFSAPLNTSVLNLYDTGTLGPADATLVGQATGSVTGSMVVSADGKTITFIKTTGLLAPDTYTITLNSGANAFVSTTGALLDGNGDGTPGDNLTYTFTVNPLPSNAVVVSIPDFTRGYGQPVNVPASSTSGLPITLSTGENVSGVDLTLQYNPELLTLSGFTTAIPGASALFNVTTPGTAIITISSAGQFSSSAGAITLGDLTASVPDNAPYGSKQILQITNLSVFDDSAIPQPLPSVAQDAIQVAAYFGDTSGDQTYSTPDVTLEQRLIGLINNGFPAYPSVDPVLIGDITLNGLIQANDTTSIQRLIGLVNVPNVPALPVGLPAPPTGGPDPTIFIPNESGNQGDTVTVPVELTVTEQAGITVSGFQVAIAYDPSEFTVGVVAQLGPMFSSALGFSPYLTFPKPGELIFQASSPTGTDTIPLNTTTDLFTLSFTVNSNAPNGTSVINLLQNIQTTSTAIFDNNLTELTLSPAPANNPTDSVDGVFQIGATTLSSIAVSPVAPSVAKGLTEQFAATGTYSDGSTQDLTNQVTWASATASVATISNAVGTQGLASTLATGTTVITATLGGVTSPGDTLTVTAAALQSIALTPVNPSIANGLTEQFTATGTYTDGTTADLTTQVTWASATASVATISNAVGTQGLASTLATGTTVITAALDGVTSPGDTLTVTAAALQSIALTPANPSIANGLTEQFAATGTYTDGTTADLTTQVTWASATASVATISNAVGTQGLATTLAMGTTVITAALGGVTSPGDSLTVTAAALQSIALTPANPSIAKGLTEQFAATGTYTDGTTADLTTEVIWASATPSVATISPAGVATGVGTGTTDITASLGGVTSPGDTFTVTAAALQSIALTPANPSIAKGLTEQFAATGTYTDGTTADLTTEVIWASATPSVATIRPAGVATGVGTGTTDITASLGGVTSPGDTLTVTAAALQSIALTPASPSIAKGLTEQFAATGTYTDGTTADLTPQVTWASATPSVATISPAGLATGVGTGTSAITASLGGVTSPGDSLTVTATALQSIALTPANPSIAKGLTEQFAATGTYTDGTTADLTTEVIWASATPSVATITPAGLATGVGTGTTDITASLGGATSPGDTLTVTAPTVTVSATSVQWGSETVLLQTAGDGLRLLPVGRNTDLPWLNINRIAITLSQSADLNPGDVSVTGITGGNYGPVTISGSGTSNVLITLSKPISAADRVTITIGNAEIITYTRRLDVLPGDVTDDGAVNTTDGLYILYNETPAHAYQAIYDLNGDGAVNATDFTLYRPFIGTVLPGLSPQLAAGGAGPGGAASLTPDELAPVLTEAIDEWAAAGLPARDVARLRGDTVQITTLPVGYLGATAIGGTTVYLSADADGYGWFIDPSHSTNAAFARPVAATELLAASSTPPAGHEDLLTVVMHELGHTLGLGDLDPAEAPADLMAETLATGVRRLPSAQDVVKVMAMQAAAVQVPAPAVLSSPALVDAVLGVIDQEDTLVPTEPDSMTATKAGRGATRVRIIPTRATTYDSPPR